MSNRLVRLFSSSLVVSGSRLAGAGAGFLAQFLLAKMLGAEGLGLFYVVTSLVAVLGILAVQGYPSVMVRFLARYRGLPARQAAFVASARRHAAAGAGLFMLGMLAAAALWPVDASSIPAGLVIGALGLPFLARLGHFSGVAAAQRRFDIAYIPETLARPVLLLIAVAMFAVSGATMSGPIAVALFVAITAIVALAQAPAAMRLAPRERPASIPPRLARHWRREARTAVIVALFVGAFADVAIVLAAPLMAKADTAVFGLCLKLSFLVGFLVQVAHNIASPDLADARNAGDMQRLRAGLRRAVLLPSAATLVAIVGALTLGGPVLGRFGPDFAAGVIVLVVLLAAQAVRALAGPSVTLLTLAGAQTQNAALCVAALVVLALANLALVPLYGALGAAVAVLLATLALQGGAALVLRRRGEPGTDVLTLALTRPRPSAPSAS